ncbi:hypothetical protein FRX31_027822 [Thalictrum thalictroides]|uniref:RNase H type-1 domain-containing protein n=1 Tax=Thalictrum thalictroides TaxID=46969 RepID=A0A7J6VBW0_THATH|nr:hypothetical protein FRX31_027822 [Thalictrum thalictroides]
MASLFKMPFPLEISLLTGISLTFQIVDQTCSNLAPVNPRPKARTPLYPAICSELLFNYAGWNTLNADGSLTENRAEYGGIIRDNSGNTITAFAARATIRSVLFLELKGIEQDIKLAVELGIKNC